MHPLPFPKQRGRSADPRRTIGPAEPDKKPSTGASRIPSEFAPDSNRHTSHPRHKILKISRKQRLLAVALGLLWSIVHLDHDGIRTRSDRRQSHGGDKFSNTDSVSWIVLLPETI